MDEPALPEPEAPKYQPLPQSSRRGIGLCLSGGGYRATLFHLGGLRRLNELGILARDDFRTVSSVSGGSIAAAHLGTALATRVAWPMPGPIPDEVWDREVRDPLRELTRHDIRTGAVVKRLWPWNWFRASTAVETIAMTYEKRLSGLRLRQLPERPGFVLCATDMAFGVNWIFTRDRMGDYLAGYMKPPEDFALARAVAASACFPPVFNPLPMRVPPGSLKGGKAPAGPARDSALADLRLTDGGDYDNMGLEPVWKNHAVVLVSDAGGLFTAQGDKGLLWRIPRYQGIQEAQARGLRKRWLIAAFITGTLQGTYWGVGSAVSRYGRQGGYSKAFAHEVIAEIRTDLDQFSDAEAAVLENHGYLLVDAALRCHMPNLATVDAPLRVPHPAWIPPGAEEPRVREALRGSDERKLFGR
jgi:NTE family protein